MSVNLKIGFNNNFITNNSHTKFLGVTMDNILSWNNHIDLLMKKFSMACYINRNAKTCMSASSLKMIYYAFFYPAISCGVIFWGNSSHSYGVIFWGNSSNSYGVIFWGNLSHSYGVIFWGNSSHSSTIFSIQE